MLGVPKLNRGLIENQGKTNMYAFNNKCVGCQCYGLTRREQQKQFSRMIQRGLTAAEARSLMPRCGKCTTEALAAKKSDSRQNTAHAGL
jgi:hypothetical protein